MKTELVNEVLELILKLAKQHQVAMLIVTHEMQFAKEVADKILFIDEGSIKAEGRPSEIFSLDSNTNTRIRTFLKKFHTAAI